MQRVAKNHPLESTAVACPPAWLAMQQALAQAADALKNPVATQARMHLRGRVAELQSELQEAQRARPPRGVDNHRELRAIDAQLKQTAGKLSALLDGMSSTFARADDNAEHLVVVVFGEVNAGKSGLANHVAGFDFDLPPAVKPGEAFVEKKPAPGGRLREQATECTFQYQGFRMPGMLWVDCPGVLSATQKNADLARRQVESADLILVTSNSDAPLKESEALELKRLLQLQGAQVPGIAVVTKCDRQTWDCDEAGAPVYELHPFEDERLQAQRAWGSAQLQTHGLDRWMQGAAPIALSTYVARKALGRRPASGERERELPSHWQETYAQSRYPELFERIAHFARTEGPTVKAAWHAKQRRAIHQRVRETLAPEWETLCAMQREHAQLRQNLQRAKEDATEEAEEHAAACVSKILTQHGIRTPEQFDEASARLALEKDLQDIVQKTVKRHFAADRVASLGRCRLAEFAAIPDTGPLAVEQREATKTVSSDTKGRGFGRGIGGLLGGAAGSFVPGAGNVVIGVLGVTVGGVVGAKLGNWLGSFFRESRTVVIPAGNNADEVIGRVVLEARGYAQKTVQNVFACIEQKALQPKDDLLQAWRKRLGDWMNFFEG